MSDKITFYMNPMSRARMVHWMLEEVGAPYEIKVLDFKSAEHKKPSFLAVNPMGKLPTIVHKGVVVTETPAIIAYLADQFPAAKLAPAADSPNRGPYLRWFFFAASCLEPAVVDKMLNRPSGDRPSALSYGSFEDAVNATEAALKPGPYILGNQFSAVDLYFSSQIAFGFMTKQLPHKPAFDAYLARCTDRPACARYLEQTAKIEAELKARG